MKPLSTDNLVAICVAMSVIAGWFINGIIQRRFELSKERFKARFTMLKEGLDLLNNIKLVEKEKLAEYISTASFRMQVTKTNELFMAYGTDREIMHWNEFHSLVTRRTLAALSGTIETTIEILRANVRHELRL